MCARCVDGVGATARSSSPRSAAARSSTRVRSARSPPAATRTTRSTTRTSTSWATRSAPRACRRASRAIPTTRCSRWSDTETEFGDTNKVKMKVPIFTGALGSTEIARKNWEHFAVGAAISGVSIVCGENVCGIDPELELDANGKVINAPDMKRRVELFRRYQRGRLRRHPRADERRGHAPRRRRVLRREARRRRRWSSSGARAPSASAARSRSTASSARSSCRRAATSSPPTRATPRSRPPSRDGAIRQFERHSRLGFVEEEALLRRGPAPARPGRQARHAQDRRLPHARARHGDQVGEQRQDRPAHHRRRARRHRHEPVAHDGGVGRPHLLPAVHGQRARREARAAGRLRPRHRDRRRLLHRGPRVQGARARRAAHQGRLHGPRAHDPGLRRQEHRASG